MHHPDSTLPVPDPVRGSDLPTAPSERVSHLLAAARKAFIATGFDGVSIDAISRDSGVSKETIYRHFADKQSLFRAALEEVGSEFSGLIEVLRQGTPPPGEELAAMALAIFDAAVDGGLLSPMWLAAGVAGLMPEFADELQQAQWRRMEPVRGALEAVARARGIADPVPLELALDFGSLAVEGPALLLGFEGRAAQDRELLARRVAQLFGDGVLANRGAAMPAQAPIRHQRPPAELLAPHIRALLDVAAHHFLERGYHGASLGEIGAEARVGRGTIYRHFSSKAGLFDAVLRDLARQLADAADVPALLDGGAVDDTLVNFVIAAIGSLASPASIALHRIAITASRSDPALARMVHDTVREPWTAPLAQWLEAEVGLDDPHWFAGQLLVLALKGNRMFTTGRGIAADERPAHARRAVAIFLHGFARGLKRP